MDVIESVRALGAALQQDDRYLAYQIAKQANDADEALQDEIARFNQVRMNLNTELSKEDKDDFKIKETNEEVRKLYARIMSNENMQMYNKAKSELDEMVNQVNSIITLSLNGEDPQTCEPAAAGCGGSCSSCAGCG